MTQAISVYISKATFWLAGSHLMILNLEQLNYVTDVNHYMSLYGINYYISIFDVSHLSYIQQRTCNIYIYIYIYIYICVCVCM